MYSEIVEDLIFVLGVFSEYEDEKSRFLNASFHSFHIHCGNGENKSPSFCIMTF